ncbi:MAG TPA: winged helix-turn-helix domain-containing tetratricopeptide repeat protein [Gemmatimonadales bacterium]|nr:winged helix-turn-helix domain-containing tetratricopeptide repeat protein [Gemmatimonadales bacterium]
MRYLFGDCTLDTDRRELHRGSTLVPVEPQVFDLLEHLLRHRDRVVSKDELLASVWSGRIVSDSAIFTRINAARSAIGDTGDEQRLIKTLPRKGLRFVGEVREVETPATGAPDAPSWIGRTADHRGRGTLPLPDRPSIVVLPFTNMSGDPEHEYFADGISDDLTTGLARIRWLFVIARNSAFVYKHRAVDVRQVASELGVRYVLEGSVRRAGTRVRISAQLIDAVTSGYHWAERYDRELGDIFAVQDEITRHVAAAIEPQVLAAEGLRASSESSENLGAWDLVARARTNVWRLTGSDYEIAIDGLQRAAAAYPDYAPARSLLGYCLVVAAHMGWIDRDKGLPPGREHASRALMLDDRDSWAHIALGYCALMEKRTEEAIAAFRQAVGLNPNSAAAHAHLSRGLAFSGQDREAIEHAEEAIRLSPLDPDMALFLGGLAIASFAAGRYADAARYATEAVRLRAGFQGVKRMRCASLAQAGNIDEARSLLAMLLREQPQLSIDWVKANTPWQTPELMGRYLEGLRKAGLR